LRRIPKRIKPNECAVAARRAAMRIRSGDVLFGRGPVAFSALDGIDRIAHPATDPHIRGTNPFVAPAFERSRTDPPAFSDFSAGEEHLQFRQRNLL